MRNIEIYYNTLLNVLNYIIDKIEEYVAEPGSLSEEKIDFLLEKQLVIKKEKYSINTLKINTSIYENISEINSIINDIASIINLENIPYNIKVVEMIINRINVISSEFIEDGVEGLEHEYNSSKLIIKKICKEKYDGKNLYFVSESQSILIVLSFNEVNDSLQECEAIINQITQIEILVSILEKIDFRSNLKNINFILTDIDCDNENAICNYINMVQVIKGNVIHESRECTYSIQLKNRTEFNDISKYIQFSDVFLILSEFNEERNILNKYLRLYQIIENFMFRIPICELVDDTERMFNIRDFNNLYTKIDNNEPDAIKKFFKKALLEKDKNNTMLVSLFKVYIDEFKDMYSSELEDIVLSVTDKNILVKMEINNIRNLSNIDTNTSIQNNLIAVSSKLVYRLRNSIVHNKATEFHLTNNNLDDNLYKLLDKLIIPILIEMIYFLITNKSKCITYQSNKLCLYPEI